MTLPVSENWIADFNNSRCYRNYTYDSGWIYNGFTYATDFNHGYFIYWNNPQQILCRTLSGVSSCTVNGYTYYVGSVAHSELGEVWSYSYYVKETQSRVEYRTFSSF